MSRWKPFVPSFDKVSKEGFMPLPRAIEVVRRAVHRTVEQGPMKNVINELFVFAAELEWHRLGRPAYRVHKDLGEMLLETSLDLDTSHVRFPHPVFSLEIPSGLEILNNTCGRLEALLISSTYTDKVWKSETPSTRSREMSPDDQMALTPRVPDPDHGEWTLNVTQCWSDEESANNMLLVMIPGENIADRLVECLRNTNPIMVQSDPRPVVSGDENTRRILSLAIGASLFAIGANRRYVKRLGQHGRKKKRRRAKERTESKHRWSLGADIQLPRAGSRRLDGSDAGDEEHRSLTFSHWRQGHLRLQPAGPKDKREYSLKYIAPMKVRPDLPSPKMATRHAMHRGTE